MYQVHIYNFIQEIHNSIYNNSLLYISKYFANVFDTERAYVYVFVFCVFMYLYGKKYNAKFIFLNYTFALSAVYMLKYIVSKDRNPMMIMIENNSPAFPSGHVTFACITSLLLFYYLRFVSNKFSKYFILCFAILFTPFMAFSRLYLYAHDLYDISASIVISIIIFAVLYKNRILISKIYIPFIDEMIDRGREKVIRRIRRTK